MNTIIEFGSITRRESDKYSDKDILIIYKEKFPKDDKKLYTNQGYSVSIFNTKKAKYLTSNGSLFFKHIILEGNQIKGRNDLKELGKLWYPLKNYDAEIEDNLDLLSCLANTPNNIYGVLAAIDISITSIRNILIRKLANQGMYLFSWIEILIKSIELNMLTKAEANCILAGRKLKKTYRNDIYFTPSEEIIENINSVLSRFDQGRKIAFSTHKKIINQPEKFTNGSYAQLRAIELLCAEYKFSSDLKQLRSLTQQPAYFCSTKISDQI